MTTPPMPMLPDSWFTLERPVLLAAAAAYRQSAQMPPGHNEIVRITGLQASEVAAAVDALEGKYLEVNWLSKQAGLFRIVGLTPAARTEVGLWPNPESALDRLVAVLEQQIASTLLPEEKSRLQKVRDLLVSGSREVIIGVMTAFLTGQLPGAT